MMYIGIHSQCHAPTVGGVTPLSLSSHDRYSSSNKLRSSWRVKTVVGFFIVITSFYCLLLLLDSHFQFGTQLVDKRNEGVFQSNTKTAAAADDDEDDDNDDPASSIFTAGNPPCPFPPPEVTGFKNWTLYPKESYDGLSILRPRKESILQTAFPGCVPFVLPKQKLLFFTVYKVSSTVFTQVAKRLDGIAHWAITCGNIQNPMTTNLTYLTDIPPKYAEQLLLDPGWTKAVFVRDPKERVLSAYLDKAIGGNPYVKLRCCAQKSDDDVYALMDCHDPESLPNISFHNFLTVVIPKCRDAHWCLQSDLMRPIQWEQINFVGHFDNLEEDTHRLLDRLRVWDEVGASGWPPKGGLYAGSSTVRHRTGAHDRMREYYTPELEDFADKFYGADYDSSYLGLSKYRLFDA